MKLAVKRAKLWEAPSDGSHHTSPEAVIAHERDKLIERVAAMENLGERLQEMLDNGEFPELRADILEFARLLRPPRAKRGSKTAAREQLE